MFGDVRTDAGVAWNPLGNAGLSKGFRWGRRALSRGSSVVVLNKPLSTRNAAFVVLLLRERYD